MRRPKSASKGRKKQPSAKSRLDFSQIEIRMMTPEESAGSIWALGGKSVADLDLLMANLQAQFPEKRRPSPKLLLGISLIPQPLWGKNLRLTLGDYQWNKLKNPLREKQHSRCSVCDSQISGPPDYLSAHESWSYDTRVKPAKATLVSIEFVCKLCHAIDHWNKHIDLMQSGRVTPEFMRDAVAHFCKVNRTSYTSFIKHRDEAQETWRKLSALTWDDEIDFGPYQAVVEVVLARRAERTMRSSRKSPRVSANLG